MRRRGFSIVRYLDDFLIIGRTYFECNSALHCLLNLLGSLGFAVNWEKVVSPCTRIKCLGVILDSVEERLELPVEKLDELRLTTKKIFSYKNFGDEELQSLFGHMTFASRAVHGARTFSRIFIDALTGLRLPHHRTRITKLLASELLWWCRIAPP